MAVFKCKMCGGNLNVHEGKTVFECEYCGTNQTIPSADNEKKVNSFNRANHLRSECDFDKAAGVYESIVSDFPEEPEAYWGLCLCKFGIEYVDDRVTGKKVPTCHRTSYESIFDDSNFDMVMEWADSEARSIYRAEAKEIDRLQNEILSIAKNEQPFDVFICYKETDDKTGLRTVDSELAHDIYDVLTEKGYKVFFSRITLKSKLGQDFEPYIFSALNSARIMLALGTKYEYYNAPWVKNEWSRFLEFMTKDKTKTLIPCFRDIDAYDMPREFKNLQAQDLSSPRAFQDLVSNIEKIVPLHKNEPQKQAAIQQIGNPATDSLLKRSFICLEDSDWAKADNLLEQVLNFDPENAQAYLGKLLAEFNLRNESDLASGKNNFANSNNYKRVMLYGDEDLKSRMQKYFDISVKYSQKLKVYNNAFQTMKNANSVAQIQEAKKIFLSLEDFEDASQKARECDKRVDTLFNNAVKKMHNSMSFSDLMKMKRFFSLMGDYPGAAEYEEKCDELLTGFPTYDEAVNMMNSGDAVEIMKARNIFIDLGDYLDSNQNAKKCTLLAEQDFERLYNKALTALSCSNYRDSVLKARKTFVMLGNYRDSEQRVKECDIKLSKLKE